MARDPSPSGVKTVQHRPSSSMAGANDMFMIPSSNLKSRHP